MPTLRLALLLLLLPFSAAAMVVTPADAPVPALLASEFTLGTLTPSSSVPFSHYIPQQQTPPPGVVGFNDDWVFGVSAPAVVDSWVASFGLGSSLGVSGLQVRLVEWTSGGAGTVLQDWAAATPVAVNGQTLHTTTLGAYGPLAAGTPYAIQVQGTAYGLAGGAYSGGLNLSSELPTGVPLPAALPLFLSALGVLGWAARRRRA